MTDFRIRENMCWYRLKILHFRISEDMKQTVMDPEHFIREMMMQASWRDLDARRYGTVPEAEKGHLNMIEKWRSK